MWKGALAGLVGGLVASWVMNQFQAGLTRASEVLKPADQGKDNGQPSQPESDEDATMKAAEAISKAVLDRQLTSGEKQAAGPVIHYVFGSAIGGIYGTVAELAPYTTAAWGLPFGIALWLGADEIAVPAFGLSKSPREYPVSIHASALGAHLVYGLTTDVVRRGLRAALQ